MSDSKTFESDQFPELAGMSLQCWGKDDRQDAVAFALRRLFLRVECCPCLQNPRCRQCDGDINLIHKAWDESDQ
jgi:hypothetical protein